MNNQEESEMIGAQGRGSNQNPLQSNANVLFNDLSLRRPYVTPPEVQQDITRNSSLSDQRFPVSMLSADAPEFVPRFGQNSVVEHNSHGSAAPMQPEPSASNESFGFCAPQFKYVYHPVIVQINDLVVNLSLKPHKFDHIASKMTSILLPKASDKVSDREIMKEAVSVIFEQGVGEPNFRFNGGRLCQHLSKNVGASFKTLLLLRCQEEFNCRDYFLETDQSRLCGFTLFLSDIYVNVLTAAGQPLEKLSEALCTLLILLLAVPLDSTLKCVVQSLKGTGCLLDRCNKAFLSKVMDRVKDVALTTRVSDNIRSQLLSVVELRAANWGRRTEESIPPCNLPSAQIGTVFYGADGKVERIEEDNNYSSSSDSEDLQNGVPLENVDMDDEISRAFEEFLRTQNS